MDSPHHAVYAPNSSAVTTAREKVIGPRSAAPVFSRVVLNHYAIKSREDFETKKERGNGMHDKNQIRGETFWNAVELR